MKNGKWVWVAGLIAVSVAGAAFSQRAVADAVAGATAKQAVNVGNKVCPVMGNVINEKYKVTYEYNGKVYNFCCSGCIDAFKAEPEKFIAIVEKELAEQKKP